MIEVFKKYLKSRCSESEFDAFVNLFLDTKKQQELERNMAENWRTMKDVETAPDLSAVLYKIHFEMNKMEVRGESGRKLFSWVTRIAAVLFVPLALAFFLNIQNDEISVEPQTVSTPLASKTKFLLPDGSIVHLNAGSSLTYPRNFASDKRLVQLTGEAYFDVVKDDIPFEVETSVLTVNVYGTAFNVMTYKNAVPEVTLERGKVSVSTENGIPQILKPGEQALIDTLSRSISVHSVETGLFTSWINNKLIFRNEPLGDVIQRLERWYNISIEMEDDLLAQKKLNATIEYESVSEVMELLEITLPLVFKYDKNERKLLIKSNEP